MSKRQKKSVFLIKLRYTSYITCMPKIPQNLHGRAIGILNAGMTMNAVAMNRCSTRAIRHLMQRFQATGLTEDRLRSGYLRVMTRGQDRFLRSTHLRNRFQTATATAANTHGTYNNRISAQTVQNRFREGGVKFTSSITCWLC